MDFNDVDSRLTRLYHSIGAIVIQNHTDQVSFSEKNDQSSNERTIKVNIGPTDKTEVEQRIETVIANLAKMRDSLKGGMASIGNDPKLVEAEIDNSLALQLIIDLDNQFKHTYPLTHRKRSNKDPFIVNIVSSIRIYGAGTDSEITDQIYDDIQNDTVTVGSKIQFDLQNGSHSYQHGSNTHLIISADVVDGQQIFIIYLNDLINDALLRWEMFVSKFKLKKIHSA